MQCLPLTSCYWTIEFTLVVMFASTRFRDVRAVRFCSSLSLLYCPTDSNADATFLHLLLRLQSCAADARSHFSATWRSVCFPRAIWRVKRGLQSSTAVVLSLRWLLNGISCIVAMSSDNKNRCLKNIKQKGGEEHIFNINLDGRAPTTVATTTPE